VVLLPAPVAALRLAVLLPEAGPLQAEGLQLGEPRQAAVLRPRPRQRV
jgi:hypothetical protein